MIKAKSSLIQNSLSRTKNDKYILSWINVESHSRKKVLSTAYGLNTTRQVWIDLASQIASIACSLFPVLLT
jgi:hypothetical protein